MVCSEGIGHSIGNVAVESMFLPSLLHNMHH